jgi:hypothetical protein
MMKICHYSPLTPSRWESASRDQLNKARVEMAKVINYGKRKVADPVPPPSAKELQIAFVKGQWDDCVSARQEAGQGTSTDAFIHWPSDDGGKTPTKNPKIQKGWPYQFTPYKSYGPFRVLTDKDPVPKGDNIYIFFYKAQKGL